jgi:hypothetical protein
MNPDSSPPTPQASSEPRPSITESPWFWAYVFATGGVVALLLGTSKYEDRQEQIERQYLARQRAGQVVARQDQPLDRPDDGGKIIPIWPLALLMTLILCVAWMVFWYQRRHVRGSTAPGASGSSLSRGNQPE